MSRAFSPGLKTALDARPNAPGRLLLLAPVGLPVVYLNTIGVDYTFEGNVYRGNPGFVWVSGRITDSSESSIDIQIPLLAGGPVAPDDVTRGLYQGAAIVTRIIDFEAGEVSPPFGFKWSVGKTDIIDDGKGAFTFRNDSRSGRELVLKTIGPGCRFDLGSTGCGVDVLGAWTDAVTIVDWFDAVSFSIDGARPAAVDGFFDRGAVKFTSGQLAGRAFTVRAWDQDTATVKLWEPLPAPIEAGDAALIHAGCNKKRGAGGCAKFANNRYQGFDHLPADDAKFTYAGDAPAVVSNPPLPPFSTGWGRA
ncbi:DUF2163 domain-containing protein [Mesorhizobium sp. WSM3626]|uniref:DUF2163 domain-containing protein n=1 Tax=Mesorhizobium sp. WSM3626 TaxID=1040987 RepID=UPI00047FD667|nr:DUF2163 domain-containing protein [Mesorhizobium sp. WSM3626]